MARRVPWYWFQRMFNRAFRMNGKCRNVDFIAMIAICCANSCCCLHLFGMKRSYTHHLSLTTQFAFPFAVYVSILSKYLHLFTVRCCSYLSFTVQKKKKEIASKLHSFAIKLCVCAHFFFSLSQCWEQIYAQQRAQPRLITL